jgi:putative membrane protein
MKSILFATSAALALVLSGGAIAQQDKSTDKSSQQSAKRADGKERNGGNADGKRLKDLAQANLAEIEAGKLAATQASSPEVKKFAQQMVDDHTKQLQEVQKLAQSKNVELPSAPDNKHQRAMKRLQGMSGADFDREYMRMQVKDHRDAHKLAEGTAKRAKDADVKAAAQKAAPEIQQHLQTAQQISAQQKGGAASGKSGKSSKNAEGNQGGAAR